MTFLEAINALENRAFKLGITYPDGTKVEPIVAIGEVGAFSGEKYDAIIDDFESGKITIEAYFLEMMKLIEKYSIGGRTWRQQQDQQQRQ